MAVLKMFSVFDQKAGLYLPPFYMRTRGEAVRAFMDTVSDRKHVFNRYAEDFTLFELGQFDEATCAIETHLAMESIARAIELKALLPDQTPARENGHMGDVVAGAVTMAEIEEGA